MADQPAFSLRGDAIHHRGKAVGTLRRGSYEYRNEKGELQQGSVAALLQAHVAALIAAPPTGRLRVTEGLLDVLAGNVFFGQTKVGTLSANGEYSLEFDGRRQEGNAFRTPGAVFISGTGPTALVTVAGRSYSAVDGVIYDGYEVIGSVSADGAYRGVCVNGDCFEGQLNDPQKAVYLKLLTPEATP